MTLLIKVISICLVLLISQEQVSLITTKMSRISVPENVTINLLSLD